jgi:hypothetical protein
MEAYTNKYTVNGKEYKLDANFLAGTMTINGKRFSLDTYTNFEGNINDFITQHFKE